MVKNCGGEKRREEKRESEKELKKKKKLPGRDGLGASNDAKVLIIKGRFDKISIVLL